MTMLQPPRTDQQHRATLQGIARRAMLERGLLPGFPPEVIAEVQAIQASAGAGDEPDRDAAGIRDLRSLMWVSIDNDDSRDLDQLTVAEAQPGQTIRIRVAVADVDALVKDGSAIDRRARHNTTSVYTAAEVFPMLPEALSTDLTSHGCPRTPIRRRSMQSSSRRRPRIRSGSPTCPFR